MLNFTTEYLLMHIVTILLTVLACWLLWRWRRRPVDAREYDRLVQVEANSRTRIETLQGEREALDRDLAARSERIDFLLNERRELDDEILTHSLQAESDIDQSAQVRALQAALEQWRTHFDASELAREQTSESLAAAIEANSQWRAAHEADEHERRQLRLDLAAARQQAAELRGDSAEAQQAAQADLARAHENLAAVTNDLGETTGHIGDLDVELGVARTQISDLQVELGAALAAKRDIESELRQVDAERIKLEAKLTATTGSLTRAQGALHAAQLPTAERSLDAGPSEQDVANKPAAPGAGAEVKKAAAKEASGAVAGSGAVVGAKTAAAKKASGAGAAAGAKKAVAKKAVAKKTVAKKAGAKRGSSAPVASLTELSAGGWHSGTTKLGTPGATHNDDLQVVNGIGPKMERLLNGFGIRSWEQLAAFTKADVAKVDAALEDFPGRIDRDEWVAQARAIIRNGHTPVARVPRDRDGRTYVTSWKKGTTKLGTPGAGHHDDLKVISGIGPKMESILNSFGITSWEQLAGFSTADVATVTEAIDAFPGRIERDEWVKQAKVLVKRFKLTSPYNRPTRETI